jgi:hypothetical protein
MALLFRYCTCGCVLKTDVPPRRKQQALAHWYATHSGDGHDRTDAAGAEAARMGTNTGIGRESRRTRQ